MEYDYIVPLKYIEYGVYVDLITIYPKPCFIYLITGDYMNKKVDNEMELG